MIFSEGPQVVLIDDMENEVEAIEKLLSEKGISWSYFDPLNSNHPEEPLSGIKTVFLDLFYQTSVGEIFDSEVCASWINSMIPKFSNYNLVIWSKDSNKGEELINVLRKINKSPSYHFVAQKSKFISKEGYLADDLLKVIKLDFSVKENVVLGEIIELEEEHVLINCLLKRDPEVFQVRRFPKNLFSGINSSVGTFVSIVTISEPGRNVIEIRNELEDHSEIFDQKDYFAKYNNEPFKGED